MKLQKCGIEEFSRRIRNRKIVCFGASPLINEMCSLYYQFKFWRNICAIADNNTSKHGTQSRVMWNKVDIISVDELVRVYSKDNSLALLITVGQSICIDVVNQLNAISELDDIECYLYPLFPCCDSFEGIPEIVAASRSKEMRIPKVIHYIWVGGSTIPEKNIKWMESWKTHCPDYEIKQWNESNYDIEKNQYLSGAYKSGKYGYVPDCMRLDIVYQHGGIYLDVDVELKRNFDELLYYSAYFGMGNHTSINPGNGFGAAPGNELIKEMRDVYEDVSFINRDGSLNLVSTDYYQTEVLKRHGFTGGNKFSIVRNAAVFPTEFFSPMNTAFGIMQLTKNCYSIHHFDNTIFEPDVLKRRISDRQYMQSLLGGIENDT